MKRSKLVGLLVASFGIVASFAAASALYLKSGDTLRFGIGASYSGREGAITYKINDSTSGVIAPKYCTDQAHGDKEDGAGLGGDYTQLKYEFELSATFTPQTIHAQNVVVGKFSIEIDQIHEDFENNGFTVYVRTDGYTDNTLGKYHYEEWNNGADYAISAKKVTAEKELAVASAGTQKVIVYVKFQAASVDADALLDLNEAQIFRFTAKWEESSGFKPAYVVGSMTNWQEDDAYAMVPNINHSAANKDDWEWAYFNLNEPLINGAKAKAKTKFVDENDTNPETKTHWCAGDDVELDPNKTYTVTWNGVNGGTATWTEHIK